MTYLRSMLFLVISILLLSSCRHSDDLSQSVKDFVETNQAKGHFSLFFYPSTIRMLNYEKDSSFTALVKNIKKLKIITYKSDKDSISPAQVQSLIANIRKESFIDLMQMKQNNQQFLIFLQKENNKPREFLGIVYSENSLTIVDLLGNIPISSLPSLISGKIKLSGLTSVINNPMSQKRSKQKHGKRSSDQ